MSHKRYGITTVGRMKKHLSGLPDEMLIMVNEVGNLSLIELKDNVLKAAGYVEMTNFEIWDEDDFLNPDPPSTLEL